MSTYYYYYYYMTTHVDILLLYYMTTHVHILLLVSTYYYYMTTHVSAYYYRPRGVDCAFVPPPPPPTLPAPASFLSYSLILCPVFSASFLRRASADTCASSLRVDDSINSSWIHYINFFVIKKCKKKVIFLSEKKMIITPFLRRASADTCASSLRVDDSIHQLIN